MEATTSPITATACLHGFKKMSATTTATATKLVASRVKQENK